MFIILVFGLWLKNAIFPGVTLFLCAYFFLLFKPQKRIITCAHLLFFLTIIRWLDKLRLRMLHSIHNKNSCTKFKKKKRKTDQKNRSCKVWPFNRNKLHIADKLYYFFFSTILHFLIRHSVLFSLLRSTLETFVFVWI